MLNIKPVKLKKENLKLVNFDTIKFHDFNPIKYFMGNYFAVPPIGQEHCMVMVIIITITEVPF